MVTRKTAIVVLLVPLVVCTLVVTVSSGGPPKPQTDYEKWMREHRIPNALDRLRDTTHRPVNPKARAAFERLQKTSDHSNSSQKWLVRWDSTTGCATELWGGRLWCQGANRRDQATRLLNDYFDLFWQPDPRLKTPKPEFKVSAEPAGNVGLDMYSQGLKVFRAGFRVGFERDGSIGQVGANVPILQEIEVAPRLTPREAAELVWGSGKTPAYGRVPDSPELVIYPSRPPRLMYSVFVDAGPHLLVDANTGEIFPGLWKGPLHYQGEAEQSLKGGDQSPAVHRSSLQPRLSSRRVSSNLDSVQARFRRVDGTVHRFPRHDVEPQLEQLVPISPPPPRDVEPRFPLLNAGQARRRPKRTPAVLGRQKQRCCITTSST